jgi:hypothetical protein
MNPMKSGIGDAVSAAERLGADQTQIREKKSNGRKQREMRLAATERGGRKGSEIPSAGCGREEGGGGKRRVGKWANPGLIGPEVGKWTGSARLKRNFARLGPDDSTQVVDFPHLTHVRLFWGGMKREATDETRISTDLGKTLNRRERRKRSQAKPGTNREKLSEGLRSVKISQNISDFYAIFREISRFYAQIMAVFTRFLASQARHKLDAPCRLFACAKRGRIVTGETLFCR